MNIWRLKHVNCKKKIFFLTKCVCVNKPNVDWTSYVNSFILVNAVNVSQQNQNCDNSQFVTKTGKNYAYPRA